MSAVQPPRKGASFKKGNTKKTLRAVNESEKLVFSLENGNTFGFNQNMDEVQFGYQPPQALAENLWEIRGEWKNKFGRRMTVIRTGAGEIFIHNAIRLHERELKWLHDLNISPQKTFYIVAPNTFHSSDAGWLTTRIPGAQLFVPKSKLDSFRKQGFTPKDVNVDFPRTLASEIQCIPMNGTRMEEAAFIHRPSRTLILCDLAFNMEPVFTGFEKFVMDLNRVGGRFGPTRLTRLLFAKNTAQLLDSYQELLKNDFDRVIVNHGAVLPLGGKEELRKGIFEIFGSMDEQKN